MFPHGKGMQSTGLDLYQYCQLRARQLFSLFTLYKPYPLLLYSMCQMQRIVSQMSTLGLDRLGHRFRQSNLTASESDVVRYLLRCHVPPSVLHSPQWWRQKLADLRAVVHEIGMPTLFVTLTADEFSPSRFPEMDALEDFLERFQVHPTPLKLMVLFLPVSPTGCHLCVAVEMARLPH
jgi:hypothetical protein